jgi:hypothetical protein
VPRHRLRQIISGAAAGIRFLCCAIIDQRHRDCIAIMRLA